MQCAITIGSTVFLFNFSTCFSNEIQTDDAQTPVFIDTILHCTYSFWGQSVHDDRSVLSDGRADKAQYIVRSHQKNRRRSTSEGPPVWLIDSASEDNL